MPDNSCQLQLWAWAHTVIRHAVSQWTHQPGELAVHLEDVEEEEEMQWQSKSIGIEETVLNKMIVAQLFQRLTPRERIVLFGQMGGWRQRDIAAAMHCHPRTIRRMQQRIRDTAALLWRG